MIWMIRDLVQLHWQIWSLKVERHKLKISIDHQEDDNGDHQNDDDNDYNDNVKDIPGTQSSRKFVA